MSDDETRKRGMNDGEELHQVGVNNMMLGEMKAAEVGPGGFGSADMWQRH